MNINNHEVVRPDLEVDSRESDNLRVTLWMVKHSNPTQLYVTIEDAQNGVNHHLDVPSPDMARHYYEHPMPYLAPSLVEQSAA